MLYLLAGVLFGIATLRAGILRGWAGGLLAVGTVVPLPLWLLAHDFVRQAAVPVRFALAWLGFALWSERRDKASEPLARGLSPELRQTAAH